MTDTLKWSVPGETFDDGSKYADWAKVEESGQWHWQYDTHEMTFDIYQHDDQFWKLYRVRVTEDDGSYAYHFGGQACRMVLVAYRGKSRSPHSSRSMNEGDLEWIRTYEFDPALHRVVRAADHSPKYGAAYGAKQAA